MGAPTLFTAELWERILQRLAEGELLEVMCANDDSLPAARTVRDWKAATPERRQQYKLARRAGCHSILAHMREVARGRGDSTGDVQRDKLIIETDDKYLRRIDPERFGDKVSLQHGGTLRVGAAEELSDAELTRIAAGSGERAALPPQG